MKEDKLQYQHHVKLKVITPVAIGDGETLSPISDFTMHPNKRASVLKLNQKKFEKELVQVPGGITDFINRIRENDGQNSNKLLYGFVRDTFKGQDPFQFFHEEAVEVVGDENLRELKTCIKEKDKPYIPGSTLKGAIKSALLYHWLKNSPSVVDRIIEYVLSDDTPRKRKQAIEKELEAFLENVRDGKNKRLSFSALRITDAMVEGQMAWYHCNRFHLKKSTANDVPIFLEAIKSDASGEFVLCVEDNKLISSSHEALAPFKRGDLSSVFEILNQYSSDNLRYELAHNENSELFGYERQLSELLDRIKSSNNCLAVLPIGFGKSNFYQSIGLIIRQKDKEAFEEYIQLFDMGKKPNKRKGETPQKDLPLTRTLITSSKVPLGWIMLYSDQIEESIQEIEPKEYKKGDIVKAKVLAIDSPKPFALVEIPGLEHPVKMDKTKQAKKNPLFGVGSIVQVEINMNKNGEINQVSFKAF
jgi:CRISPR-associated protein Csm5